MLIVTSCTTRMPPHIRTVLKYHSGKLPLCHASAKLVRPNGPLGASEATSGGTPGRSDATAIQANGTAQSSAAALVASNAQSLQSTFIMDAAFDEPERDQREAEQRRNTDDRRRRVGASVVILRRLLVDVIEQQVRRIRWAALGHRHDVIDLGERVQQR